MLTFYRASVTAIRSHLISLLRNWVEGSYSGLQSETAVKCTVRPKKPESDGHKFIGIFLDSLPKHMCVCMYSTSVNIPRVYQMMGMTMPCQSKANGLNLDNIPTQLQGLTSLERQLLAPHIPFMKLVNLPRGKQRSLHGPVVNVPVPAKFNKVCSLLPRIPKTAGLIRIKLKRQLKYKGHLMYQMVRPNVIKNALQWLKN